MASVNLDIIARFTNQASSGLLGLTGDIGKMAVVGAGVGVAALGALGGASVKLAMDFETTISSIKAVSGATNEEAAGLQKLALQLGKDTSFSAKEAASGIEELIKGGLSIPDVMSGAAKSMLDLAAAGGVSLPDAAEIASNAMAMFNLKGKDMAHVSDLIAGAANASSLSVSDFKFSMAAAGAIAAQSGQKFDDMAEAIAIMGKSGIKGADAGTSLKTFLMNLQPTTKQATAAMKELGIITATGANQFINANGSFKSMAEISGILNKATQGLTESQKLQTLQTIFGSDAIRAAAIFAKEGATGFDEMGTAMGKVTAAAVGAEKLNNLSGSLEQLKGSLETAGITFGLTFTPMLKGAADALTGLVNGAIPWIEKAGPAFIGIIQNISDKVRPVVTLLSDLGGDLLRGGFGVFADDIREMTGIDLTGTIGALRQVLDILDAGFNRVGAAFAQVISGDIVGGITSLLGAVMGARSGLVEALGGWVAAFLEWVGPMIPPLLVELGKMATRVVDWAIQQVPVMFAQFARWVDAVVNFAIKAGPPTIIELGNMLAGILGWVEAKAPTLIDTVLGEWLPAALDWVITATQRIIPELEKLLGGILDWLTANAPGLTEKLLADWVPAMIVWVARAAIDIIPKLLQMLVDIGVWFATTGVPKIAEYGYRMGESLIRGLIRGIGNIGGVLGNALGLDNGFGLDDLQRWNAAAGGLNPFGPHIPGFATGGIVPGPIGRPMLATVHGGETVIPVGGGYGGGSTYVTVNVYGSVTAERDLAETVRKQLIRVGQRNPNIFGGYA